MLHAGGVCCRMLRPLVQSPDTHGRVVATLVCLQHFGSHSRFAHAHLIFGGAYHWASYCFLHRRRSSPRPPTRRAMASSAGARAHRRQASSGENESSDAAPTAPGETSDIEYGTAVFRTSDIAFSDAVLRQVRCDANRLTFLAAYHRRGLPLQR